MSIEMMLTAGQLAESLGAAPLLPEESTLSFGGINTLDAAGPDEISFVSAGRYIAAAAHTRAGLVLVGTRLAADLNRAIEDSGRAKRGEPVPVVLSVPDLWPAVLRTMHFFHPEVKASGEVHPTAYIAPGADVASSADIGPHAVVETSAKIGERVVVGAGCYVGPGATIGDDTRLFAGVKVMNRCRIGQRCRIGPGTVIGYDGFKTELIGGRHVSIPQVGIVVLEDEVEIGANTTIDRASFHETRIGTRTKIDNLVQIGHNVTIGHDCLICAQVGIAGSVKIGPGCMFGGQVGIADNLSIAGGTILMAQTGVPSSLERGVYFGSPAYPATEEKRVVVATHRLPEFERTVRDWMKRFAEAEPPKPPASEL